MDDDERYLELLACIVEQAGGTARYARSGEEALAILREGDIATIITDLDMPGMDGLELAMLTRELFPGVNVIMVTGSVLPDIKRLADEAGITKVLAKPIGTRQIVSIIGGHGAARAGA